MQCSTEPLLAGFTFELSRRPAFLVDQTRLFCGGSAAPPHESATIKFQNNPSQQAINSAPSDY
jgi:hypothetical protein